MKNYIEVTWSGITNFPPEEIRKKIENMAAGVILAHCTGNLVPKSLERTEELTSHRKFDPTQTDETKNCLYKKRSIKDQLIEIIIESKTSYLLEVFYVWSSHKEGSSTNKREIATDRFYQIYISELEDVFIEQEE
jgi:hypothetical protein